MPTITQESITDTELRSIMRRVPSPVTVVTAAGRSEARGATIGSFTSVSLDPPLVSFNVAKGTQIHAVLHEASHFAVHLLSAQQSDLCAHFALPNVAGAEQLAAVSYHTTRYETPILDAAPAVLHCRMHDTFEVGDHTIVVGKVVTLDERDDTRPILYYDREYRSVNEV